MVPKEPQTIVRLEDGKLMPISMDGTRGTETLRMVSLETGGKGGMSSETLESSSTFVDDVLLTWW
jgi:hypothetical protein